MRCAHSSDQVRTTGEDHSAAYAVDVCPDRLEETHARVMERGGSGGKITTYFNGNHSKPHYGSWGKQRMETL